MGWQVSRSSAPSLFTDPLCDMLWLYMYKLQNVFWAIVGACGQLSNHQTKPNTYTKDQVSTGFLIFSTSTKKTTRQTTSSLLNHNESLNHTKNIVLPTLQLQTTPCLTLPSSKSLRLGKAKRSPQGSFSGEVGPQSLDSFFVVARLVRLGLVSSLAKKVFGFGLTIFWL